MERFGFVKEIFGLIGSRETVIAICYIIEYATIRFKVNLWPHDVWSHFWGSVRRRREGIEIWSWECIGGIVYNLWTKEPIEEMDDVPYPLYQRALALVQSTVGSYPQFDQKVFAQGWTYRMVATIEGGSHYLIFYRRPKFWPFP